MMLVLALICAAMGILYLFLWPKHLASKQTGWRLFVLHYFHALVWFSLALASFLRLFGIYSVNLISSGIALLAFVFYGVFLFTFVQAGKNRG
ncbi:MAG: hypothetical protein R2880_12725 [Deinococcales bacterium]